MKILKGKNQVINKQTDKNHMKIQKFASFVKKNLKINMLKIKSIIKLGTIVTMKGNIEVLHMTYVI